ncbi:MAG: hypothetical protein CL561_00410 [Alphaproteobacteria bacterium]|nr:hypothetical protein [Alphaproteobacteria bacterium]|tara:strand:+ start:27216 stop:27473 length:258 start_codon:yes stop_codon:yes gene_type:complete
MMEILTPKDDPKDKLRNRRLLAFYFVVLFLCAWALLLILYLVGLLDLEGAKLFLGFFGSAGFLAVIQYAIGTFINDWNSRDIKKL